MIFLFTICGDYFMLVINASNIEKDFKWMQENLSGDVSLKNISDNISLLEFRKNSLATLQKLTDVDLSKIEYYKFVFGVSRSKRHNFSYRIHR